MAGGSIESVTINARYFSATADSDVTRKLGGFENEVQANGDGTSRKIQTRVPWSLAGVVLSCEDSRGDHEFLQDVADAPGYVPMSITTVEGNVYQGQGTVAGELGESSQATSLSLDLMGTGKLTKQ